MPTLSELKKLQGLQMPGLEEASGLGRMAPTPQLEAASDFSSQLAPTSPGLVSLTGRVLGGGLSAVGNLLDVPGSMVRDTLALKNPLDQLVDPLGYRADENRTTGRELLRQYGAVGDEDTTGNWWSGFGAEIALDPLTYVGVGLLGDVTKAGAAAGKATSKLGGVNMLKEARRVANERALRTARAGVKEAGKEARLTRPIRGAGARAKVTPRMILEEQSNPQIRQELLESFYKGGGTEALLDQPLSYNLSFRLPFTRGKEWGILSKEARTDLLDRHAKELAERKQAMKAYKEFKKTTSDPRALAQALADVYKVPNFNSLPATAKAAVEADQVFNDWVMRNYEEIDAADKIRPGDAPVSDAQVGDLPPGAPPAGGASPPPTQPPPTTPPGGASPQTPPPTGSGGPQTGSPSATPTGGAEATSGFMPKTRNLKSGPVVNYAATTEAFRGISQNHATFDDRLQNLGLESPDRLTLQTLFADSNLRFIDSWKESGPLRGNQGSSIGMAFPNRGRIELASRRSLKSRGMNADDLPLTAIHEIMHLAFKDLRTSNPEFGAQVDTLVRDAIADGSVQDYFRGIFAGDRSTFKDKPIDLAEYFSKNPDEVIAELGMNVLSGRLADKMPEALRNGMQDKLLAVWTYIRDKFLKIMGAIPVDDPRHQTMQRVVEYMAGFTDEADELLAQMKALNSEKTPLQPSVRFNTEGGALETAKSLIQRHAEKIDFDLDADLAKEAVTQASKVVKDGDRYKVEIDEDWFTRKADSYEYQRKQAEKSLREAQGLQDEAGIAEAQSWIDQLDADKAAGKFDEKPITQAQPEVTSAPLAPPKTEAEFNQRFEQVVDTYRQQQLAGMRSADVIQSELDDASSLNTAARGEYNKRFVKGSLSQGYDKAKLKKGQSRDLLVEQELEANLSRAKALEDELRQRKSLESGKNFRWQDIPEAQQELSELRRQFDEFKSSQKKPKTKTETKSTGLLPDPKKDYQKYLRNAVDMIGGGFFKTPARAMGLTPKQMASSMTEHGRSDGLRKLLRDTGIYTDGRFFVNATKVRDSVLGTKPIDDAARPPNIDAILDQAKGLEQVRPVGFGDKSMGGFSSVILQMEDGPNYFIDQRYYDTINKLHPGAEWFAKYKSPNTPIFAKVDGEIVGGAMPLSREGMAEIPTSAIKERGTGTALAKGDFTVRVDPPKKRNGKDVANIVFKSADGKKSALAHAQKGNNGWSIYTGMYGGKIQGLNFIAGPFANQKEMKAAVDQITQHITDVKDDKLIFREQDAQFSIGKGDDFADEGDEFADEDPFNLFGGKLPGSLGFGSELDELAGIRSDQLNDGLGDELGDPFGRGRPDDFDDLDPLDAEFDPVDDMFDGTEGIMDTVQEIPERGDAFDRQFKAWWISDDPAITRLNLEPRDGRGVEDPLLGFIRYEDETINAEIIYPDGESVVRNNFESEAGAREWIENNVRKFYADVDDDDLPLFSVDRGGKREPFYDGGHAGDLSRFDDEDISLFDGPDEGIELFSDTASTAAAATRVVQDGLGAESLLNSSRMTPQKIGSIDYARHLDKVIENPDVASRWTKDAGVSEGYTIGDHSTTVVRNLVRAAENVEPWKLKRIGSAIGDVGRFDEFLVKVAALHDIGKNDAIAAGGTQLQKKYTLPLLRKVLQGEGFGEQAIRFAEAVVSHDVFGEVLQGMVTPKQGADTLLETIRSKELSFTKEAFLDMSKLLYEADASSYPYLKRRLFSEDGSLRNASKLREMERHLGHVVTDPYDIPDDWYRSMTGSSFKPVNAPGTNLTRIVRDMQGEYADNYATNKLKEVYREARSSDKTANYAFNTWQRSPVGGSDFNRQMASPEDRHITKAAGLQDVILNAPKTDRDLVAVRQFGEVDAAARAVAGETIEAKAITAASLDPDYAKTYTQGDPGAEYKAIIEIPKGNKMFAFNAEGSINLAQENEVMFGVGQKFKVISNDPENKTIVLRAVKTDIKPIPRADELKVGDVIGNKRVAAVEVIPNTSDEAAFLDSRSFAELYGDRYPNFDRAISIYTREKKDPSVWYPDKKMVVFEDIRDPNENVLFSIGRTEDASARGIVWQGESQVYSIGKSGDDLAADQKRFVAIRAALNEIYSSGDTKNPKLDSLHEELNDIAERYIRPLYETPVEWQVSSADELAPKVKPVTKQTVTAFFPFDDDLRKSLPDSSQLRPMSLKERLAALRGVSPDQYEASMNGFGAAFAENMGGAMGGDFSGLENFIGAGLDAEWVNDTMTDVFTQNLIEAFRQARGNKEATLALKKYLGLMAQSLDAVDTGINNGEYFREFKSAKNWRELLVESDLYTKDMPGTLVKATDLTAEAIRKTYSGMSPVEQEVIRKVIAPIIDSISSVDGSRLVDDLEPEWNMGRQGDDSLYSVGAAAEATSAKPSAASLAKRFTDFFSGWQSSVPRNTAAAVADFIDRGGDLFHKLPLASQLAALFRPEIVGGITEGGRDLGRARQAALQAATDQYRSVIAPIVYDLHKSNLFNSDAIIAGGSTPEQALKKLNENTNIFLELVEGVRKGGNTGLSDEWQTVLPHITTIRTQLAETRKFVEESGYKLPELDDLFAQYFPHRKANPTANRNAKASMNPKIGPLVLSQMDSQLAREFRDLPGGHAVLNDMSLDGNISGLRRRAKFVKKRIAQKEYAEDLFELEDGILVRKTGEDLGPTSMVATQDGDFITIREYVAREYGDRLFKGYDAKKFDKESTQFDKWIDIMMNLDEGYYREQMPLFGHNPISVMSRYLQDAYSLAYLGRFAQEYAGKAARFQKYTEGPGQLVQVKELFKQKDSFWNDNALDNIIKSMDTSSQTEYQRALERNVASDYERLLEGGKPIHRTVDGRRMDMMFKEDPDGMLTGFVTKNVNGEEQLVEVQGNVIEFHYETPRTADWSGVKKADEPELVETIIDNPEDFLRRTFTRGETATDFLNVFGVDAQVVDDINRFMKPFTIPEELRQIEHAMRRLTNVTKAGLTAMWPAFHIRNITSAMYMNFTMGQADPRYSGWKSLAQPYFDTYNLLRGTGKIDDLDEIPDLLGKLTNRIEPEKLVKMTASELDAELRKELQMELFSMGVIGELMGLAAEHIGDEVDNLISQFPGLNPDIISKAPTGTRLRDALNPFATKDGLTLDLKNVEKDMFIGARVGRDVAGFSEAMNRISQYIAARRNGYSPQSARDLANKLHVNYSNLSAFESRVMRLAIPFWSFSRGILPVIVQDIATRPGGPTATIIKAANRSRDPNAVVPDHIADTIGFPMGESEDGSKRYLTGLGLPFEDTLNLLDGPLRLDPAKAGRELIGRANPLIKAPLEWITGRSFFQDGPVGGRELTDLDPPIGRTLSNISDLVTGERTREAEPFLGLPLEFAAANSPLSRAVSTARTVTDPRKWESLGGAAALGANILTGIRINDVSPVAQDAIYSERLGKAIKEMGGRTFMRQYVSEEKLAKMTPEERELVEQLLDELNVVSKRFTERRKQKEAEANKPVET